MTKILIEHTNERRDGCAKCKTTSGDSFSVNLITLAEDGMRVCHDGRLEHKSLETLFKTPVYLTEISINITSLFHIHYRLLVDVKKDYTSIKILNR
jgi:hypothetical protein